MKKRIYIGKSIFLLLVLSLTTIGHKRPTRAVSIPNLRPTLTLGIDLKGLLSGCLRWLGSLLLHN